MDEQISCSWQVKWELARCNYGVALFVHSTELYLALIVMHYVFVVSMSSHGICLIRRFVPWCAYVLGNERQICSLESEGQRRLVPYQAWWSYYTCVFTNFCVKHLLFNPHRMFLIHTERLYTSAGNECLKCATRGEKIIDSAQTPYLSNLIISLFLVDSYFIYML